VTLCQRCHSKVHRGLLLGSAVHTLDSGKNPT
jgi:hypothetical protein